MELIITVALRNMIQQLAQLNRGHKLAVTGLISKTSSNNERADRKPVNFFLLKQIAGRTRRIIATSKFYRNTYQQHCQFGMGIME